jgi:hypothetical protein
MAITNPYFIRHQMGDTPGNNGGSFSSCPDIIFSTTGSPNWTPISTDPNTYLTAASYGTDYGSTVQVSPAGNVNNFVYLRALNTNPSANVPLRLWMMYTQSNLAMWPQNWRKDSIKVGQNFQNWQDATILKGGPGPYVVTGQPFLWSPTGPASGQHFCVISMVEPFPGADPTSPLSDPPFAPPSSIGYLSSFDQLAAFVLANDWFGWRNTTDVTSLGATWQQTIPVTSPDQAGQVMVGVACSNMPTDGYVAAYMQGPDVNNTLNLPKTPITDKNMQLTVKLILPASYKTNMIITYWQGATVPPYLANVAPFLGLPSGSLAAILQGRPIKRAPRYVPELDPITNEMLGWTRLHVFGSAPYVWETPPKQAKGLVAGSPAFDEVVGAVKDAGATWQRSYPVEAPSGGTFWAGYQCSNMPTDGRVALDIIGPDPAHSVVLPPMSITTPNQMTLVSLQWPPGFQGTMTISYWEGPTQPPPASRIEPIVEYPGDAVAPGTQEPPTWQQSFPITGPDTATQVLVGVQCTKIPTDGFVAMSLEPGNVTIPKSAIHSPDQQLVVPFDMPANYSGNMVISYWRGATPPPMGASIAPVVAIPGREG